MSHTLTVETPPGLPADLVSDLADLLADASQALATDLRSAAEHIQRARDLLRPPSGEAIGESGTSTRGGLSSWQRARVARDIEVRLSDRFDVGGIAASVGLSPRHFARAFKVSFGLSPHAFVMTRRLQRAKELLAGTDIPLAEVASACGLSDQAHLCHIFRRSTGTSPSSWRRNQRSIRARETQGQHDKAWPNMAIAEVRGAWLAD